MLTRMRCLPRLAREGARHAMHAGLGGGVDRHAADRFEPGVGPEIDDRALSRRDHVGGDRLGRKEHMAEVGCDALVVIGGASLLPAVPVVARRVVDRTRPAQRRPSIWPKAARSAAMSRRSQASNRALAPARVSSSASAGPPSRRCRRSRQRTSGPRRPAPYPVRSGCAAGDEHHGAVETGISRE